MSYNIFMVRKIAPAVFILTLMILTACRSERKASPSAADLPIQPPTATRTLRPTLTPFPPPTRRATLTPEPSNTPINITVTPTWNQAGERIIIQTEDGLQLIGYYYIAPQPNAPVVVLMHQFGSNQAQAWPQSDLILWLQNYPVHGTNPPEPTRSAQGKLPLMPSDLHFNVLTFDFRGHGESEGQVISSITDEAKRGYLLDAKAAYARAASLPYADPNRIIGIGTSIGADAVVDACNQGCVGAFAISPGSVLGLSWQDNAYRVTNAGKPVRCMYSVNSPSANECLSLAETAFYKVLAAEGKKHGEDFLVPRKMEAGFGQALLEFLLAAVKR